MENNNTDVLPTKVGWLRDANGHLVQISEKLLTRRGTFEVPDNPCGTLLLVQRHTQTRAATMLVDFLQRKVDGSVRGTVNAAQSNLDPEFALGWLH